MNLFSKSKTPLSFVFDIRDSSIGLAVVRFEKETKPELILCKNFPIESGEKPDHEKHLTTLMTTIDAAVVSVIKDLRKTGNVEKIGKYLFFLGSPWSVSSTKIIKILKDIPFEVNDALLQKLITSEETKAHEEITKDSEEKNWAVLEEKIIQSKLNGYRVSNIFHKKTTDVEVELFVSFVPSEIKDKISSFVNKTFGTHTLKHASSTTIASYMFLKDFYPNKNNFLYIDIGGILTDVFIVRDDIIYGTVSFPCGQKDIIEKTLDTMDISEELLLSKISAKNDGHADALNQKDLEKLIGSGLKIWTEALNQAVTQICNEMNIPTNVFVVTNNSLTNFLIKQITNKKSTESFTILGVDMKVEVINEGMMNNVITNGKNFVSEPYMKMDVLFIDKMMH